MSLAATTATPWRSFWTPGLGLGTKLHVLPSQCSTSVDEPVTPTAQTSVAATAATALKEVTSPGLGLGTMLQLVPFQCRVSVPLGWRPTAHMSLLATAATPLSVSPLAEGLSTSRQAGPQGSGVGVGVAHSGP